ncbi:MAG: hypothetical protein P1V97_15590 [Planctomycetota bacterium]|nr:hypothetical protein [Planctomycetota bacterium]
MSEVDYNEEFSIEDYEDGKLLAMLCYLPTCCCAGFVGVILAFVQKKNDFHCFHARQGLGLGILFIIFNIIGTLLSIIAQFTGFWIFNMLAGLLYMALFFIAFAVGVFGIYQCTQPEFKPLPFIGPKFIEWFSFIEKEKEA